MELLVSEAKLVSGSRWLLAHAIAVFAFLYLPIAVLILYSFNGEGVGGFPPHHLTLDWYRTLFADEADLGFSAQQFAGRVGGDGDLARLSACRQPWRWSGRNFLAKRYSGDWCFCR